MTVSRRSVLKGMAGSVAAAATPISLAAEPASVGSEVTFFHEVIVTSYFCCGHSFSVIRDGTPLLRVYPEYKDADTLLSEEAFNNIRMQVVENEKKAISFA